MGRLRESAALLFAQHGAAYAWLSRRWLTRSGDVYSATSPCGHKARMSGRARLCTTDVRGGRLRQGKACHERPLPEIRLLAA
jgi:hypothetical protein